MVRSPAVRGDPVDKLVRDTPADHRKLLFSIESNAPDWTRMPVHGVATLPAVLWRLQNIGGLTDAQHTDDTVKLQAVFDKVDGLDTVG